MRPIEPIVSLLCLAALAVLALLGAVAPAGILFLMSLILIQCIFTLGFNIAFGLSGLLSFGHAAMFAVGAYLSAYLLLHSSIPFVIIIVISSVAGALVAFVFAFISLYRAKGVYFAVLTLALAELVRLLVRRIPGLGGDDGLLGIRRPIIELFNLSLDLGQPRVLYYFLLGALLLSALFGYRLWYGRLGRMLIAIREDPIRLTFCGISVAKYHILIFSISGFIAGFSGALYAPTEQIVEPSIAHWTYSALPLLFALLGGAKYYLGAFIGTFVFMLLEYNLRSLFGVSELLTGMALLLIILISPGGIAAFATRLITKRGAQG